MNANSSALKQILVHLDATSHSSQRLAAARAIAGEHGACVTALYAVTPALLALPFAPDGGALAASILQDMDDERRATVRAAFDKMMKTEGPTATSRRCCCRTRETRRR